MNPMDQVRNIVCAFLALFIVCYVGFWVLFKTPPQPNIDIACGGYISVPPTMDKKGAILEQIVYNIDSMWGVNIPPTTIWLRPGPWADNEKDKYLVKHEPFKYPTEE